MATATASNDRFDHAGSDTERHHVGGRLDHDLQ